MRLWEALEKGSGYAGKEFKHPDGYSLVCHGDVTFYYKGVSHGSLRIPNNGWYEVEKPVTWQEAIEARADGKRVWCEFNDRSWGVAELVANHLYFRAALDDGEWYVED